MPTNFLDLAYNIADMQENFIVVFEEDEIILTNRAFNKFFGVSSTQEYKESFGDFVNNFVPHPSYFNAEKVPDGESWFQTILELDEIDRVVSFLSQKHDPHAFSVAINQDVEGFTIVTFTDITQTLIKRIMIENNVSVDKRTGAYTKAYFLQVHKSYEDAAVFNEKIISLILLKLNNADIDLHEFVSKLKKFTRNDDMIVKWSNGVFLLAFLVDDAENAQQVETKITNIFQCDAELQNSYELNAVWQTQGESVKTLLEKLL